MDEPRRLQWEQLTEWPLTAAAVVFLAAYAWPILDPALPRGWALACEVAAWGVWALFAVDYAVRWALSADRRRFVRAHAVDLLAVALPIFRPLRALRLIAVLSTLNRRAGGSFRGKVALYVSCSTALVLFIAALAMLEAERRDPAANITTFADALWWAMATMTTVGYGDHFPITPTGRLVAGGLMVAGIALIGMVTASFASWLVEKVSEATEEAAEESRALTRRDLSELLDHVAALRAELAQLRGAAPADAAGQAEVSRVVDR